MNYQSPFYIVLQLINKQCSIEIWPQKYDTICFVLNLHAGFRWDRQWLVVNSKGRAYTQRVEPKLALVEVELPNEAFSEGWEPTKSSYLGKTMTYTINFNPTFLFRGIFTILFVYYSSLATMFNILSLWIDFSV